MVELVVWPEPGDGGPILVGNAAELDALIDRVRAETAEHASPAAVQVASAIHD